MQQNHGCGRILAILALLVAGGIIFLMMHDIPAPTAAVEQAIPADRFIKP